MDCEEFVSRALTDTCDSYSWWCKNQLCELHGHPLVERYARPARRERSAVRHTP